MLSDKEHKDFFEVFKIMETMPSTGKIFFNEGKGLEQFGKGCNHTFSLLKDAYLLYKSGSFSTSVFLSISAIEEIVKLEVLSFRRQRNSFTKKEKKVKDILLNHKKKHYIGIKHIILFGDRLNKAIGRERVVALINMAKSGEINKLRSASLYMQNINEKFECPIEKIDKNLSRDLLLLAIEVWDDTLCGKTNYTYDLASKLSYFFYEIIKS